MIPIVWRQSGFAFFGARLRLSHLFIFKEENDVDLTKTKCFDAFFPKIKQGFLIFFRDYAVFECPVDEQKNEMMYERDKGMLEQTISDNLHVLQCSRAQQQRLSSFAMAALSLAHRTQCSCAIYVEERADTLSVKITGTRMSLAGDCFSPFEQLCSMSDDVHLYPNEQDPAEVSLMCRFYPFKEE